MAGFMLQTRKKADLPRHRHPGESRDPVRLGQSEVTVLLDPGFRPDDGKGVPLFFEKAITITMLPDLLENSRIARWVSMA